MANRTITASLTTKNAILTDGDYIYYSDSASHSGVAQGTVNSAVLTLTNFRVFSTSCYMTVYVGGQKVGETVKMNYNDYGKGDYVTAEIPMEGLKSALLTATGNIELHCYNNNSSTANTFGTTSSGTATITVGYTSSGGEPDEPGTDYTLCYWGDDARCWLSSAYAESEATLYWSGAVAGENNPIGGYDVWRGVAYDPNGYPADSTWEHVGTIYGTSVVVSAPSRQGEYYLYAVDVWGQNYWTEEGVWIDCETFLRRDHEALEGFTDPTLTPGVSLVKALHMTELQDHVNELRTFYGMSTYKFSTIAAGETGVSDWRLHVEEVRRAIVEIVYETGKEPDNWDEPWIDISVNCPRADVIQQLRDTVLGM